MLGLQETMSTGSPKTYSCVACSATFHNLASLLVHQASHASDISPQPDSALPTCVSCGSLFASKDLLEKHHCAMSPTQASPVHTYICDCGEEFSELTALEHHKKQHGSEDKVKSDLESIPVVPDSKTDSSRPVSDQVFHSLSPSPSNEKPLAKSPPTSNTDIKENKSNESADMDNMDSNILKPSESHPVVEEQVQLPEQDSDALITSKVVNHSVQDNEKSPESSEDSAAFNKNSILKMLASAYMSHRQPVQMKQRNLPPRKASPRAPMQPAITLTIPKPKPLENQSKIKKDNTVVGVKTAKMLPKKSKIISVTQTLCPVVVLETRQKLFGRDNVEGRHQCRLCRRVFQDVDTLIMHHALHKKERVKFCLCCQQFVITVISVPESHVCYDGFSRKHEPLMGKMSLKPVSPTAQQAEKMFYCSLCKRGYTRMRSLKKHNCPCKASLKLLTTVGTSGNVKLQNLEECNRAVLNSKTNQMSTQHIDIGVGTESIKIEEQNTEFPIGKKDQTGLKMQLKDQLNPPKTLESVFASVSNSKPTKNSVEVPANIVEVKQEETDKLVEKQWTMPLEDAEIDVLIDVDQKDSDEDDLTDVVGDDCDEAEDVVIVEPHEDKEMKSALPSNGFQVHVTNKGLKRFVCNGCQRSYSRLFTLKEHLRMCEARELKLQNFTSSNTAGPIKRFPCPQCGKFFSRKDNMNSHRKKCHATNTNSAVSNRTVEFKTPVAQENLFVLSPSTENQAVRQESTPNTSSNRNWGIMSLPSVLPRRVTCECGASFTCPRLLFEHLQQHAQESYICPHCGENLQSWMDFEAHQQLHNQSQSSTSEQRASQQQPHSSSQVLPSHAPTRPQLSSGFSEHNIKAQPPALLAPQHLNQRPFPETLTCHKCKKNFSLRSSLSRHIRLRCTGDTAGQKKHTCSRCGTTFQSPLMLKVHIQSNTCKPAFKPIRCPVCVRWFSCLDVKYRLFFPQTNKGFWRMHCINCGQGFRFVGLYNKHLQKHPELNAHACPFCPHTFSNAQKLRNHQQEWHRSTMPFICDICGKGFASTVILKRHRVVHCTNDPMETHYTTDPQSTVHPYECGTCSASFENLDLLFHHQLRHKAVDKGSVIIQSNIFNVCSQVFILCLPNHNATCHDYGLNKSVEA
uniref:C2H2-type domain-containing protein n=1 Tax=Cyprinus carpio TaxID=7962 RepID=A0A8C2HEF5_CYPCA